MNNGIHHYCKISNGQVILDDKVLFTSKEENFDDFIKSIYKHFEIDYPKFYKMDPLCKLSIVAASLLLENSEEKIEDDMALLLSNKSSCIDVDLKHQNTIKDKAAYYPSPANFVYTLPNIALGEISIKYKLRSENSFFIFEDFNPEFMVDYANSLIHLNKASSVLCAWVEVNKNYYNAFVYKVSPKGTTEHSKEHLKTLID